MIQITEAMEEGSIIEPGPEEGSVETMPSYEEPLYGYGAEGARKKTVKKALPFVAGAIVGAIAFNPSVRDAIARTGQTAYQHGGDWVGRLFKPTPEEEAVKAGEAEIEKAPVKEAKPEPSILEKVIPYALLVGGAGAVYFASK